MDEIIVYKLFCGVGNCLGLPDSPSSCTRTCRGEGEVRILRQKADVEVLGTRAVVMYWIPLRILQGHIATAGVRRFSASVFFYSFSIVVRADVELLVLTVGEM